MTHVFELEHFLNSDKTEFNYFIYGKNSEIRSTEALDILKKKSTNIDKIITLNFIDSDQSTYKISGDSGTFGSVKCPFRDPIKGVNSLLQLVEDMGGINKLSKICLDVTAIESPYIFHLLKILKLKMEITKITVLYTAPLTYKKIGDSFLFSHGIDKMKQLDAYAGTEKSGGSKILVILLGFEGNKSIHVHKEMDPRKTIAVIGFPSYGLEMKDISILENKDLLSDPACKNLPMFAAAHDPFQTVQILQDILSLHKGQNIIISPIGSKPMSLGACIFCLQNDSIRVVYPYPNKYVKSNSPAEKVGKTWIYQINF